MSNPKGNQIIKLSLVGFAAIPLVWSAYHEYQGQPFSQTRDVISYLVEVTVLVDALLKQEDEDRK
ncbi:MAG: hypothetical protein F6K58_20555 [Symploca sp. SIO2E9]|nr:hypothetical protein [Symploca sp. SIO2E9]